MRKEDSRLQQGNNRLREGGVTWHLELAQIHRKQMPDSLKEGRGRDTDGPSDPGAFARGKDVCRNEVNRI